jgi:hypothetical protein
MTTLNLFDNPLFQESPETEEIENMCQSEIKKMKNVLNSEKMTPQEKIVKTALMFLELETRLPE